MREIHLELPFRDFVRPSTRIIDVSVCTASGLLRTSACSAGTITMPFLEGTQPVLGCDYHGVNRRVDNTIRFMDMNTLYIDRAVIQDLPMPVLRDEELLRGMQTGSRPGQGTIQLPPQTMLNNPLSISTIPNLEPVIPSLPTLEDPGHLEDLIDPGFDLPADTVIMEALAADVLTSEVISAEAFPADTLTVEAISADTVTADVVTADTVIVEAVIVDEVTTDAVLELPLHNPLLD